MVVGQVARRAAFKNYAALRHFHELGIFDILILLCVQQLRNEHAGAMLQTLDLISNSIVLQPYIDVNTLEETMH